MVLKVVHLPTEIKGEHAIASKDLRVAKENKADEFYTQLTDIELELKHYKNYFKDKIVLCNCDDPYESNFFKYFAMNFNYLGIKKLIAICFDGSPFACAKIYLLIIWILLTHPLRKHKK